MCIFEAEIETETRKMVETESLADLCDYSLLEASLSTLLAMLDLLICMFN